MKTVIVSFVLGVAMGWFGTMYYNDSSVRSATNAHIDAVVGEAAASAHAVLQTAKK